MSHHAIAVIALLVSSAACGSRPAQAVAPTGAAPTQAAPPKTAEAHAKPLSEVVKTPSGELALVQSFTVNVPVEDVWRAYTTAEGWKAWSAPIAEIDLRAGGTIRSHYTPTAKIGDPGTITLRIVNYLPLKLLTLQAELTGHFEGFTPEDSARMYSVTTFEKLSENATRVVSYGLGYLDNPKNRELLDFFLGANEKLFLKLKSHLETSEL